MMAIGCAGLGGQRGKRRTATATEIRCFPDGGDVRQQSGSGYGPARFPSGRAVKAGTARAVWAA